MWCQGMNCERALTTSARMGGPRSVAKFRTVSCERRTAKFLGGRASRRSVAEFMTTQRSKRYDLRNWLINGHAGARLLEPPFRAIGGRAAESEGIAVRKDESSASSP